LSAKRSAKRCPYGKNQWNADQQKQVPIKRRSPNQGSGQEFLYSLVTLQSKNEEQR